MKMKKKLTRRDAIALVALATAVLLVVLIFFTPPVFIQDNWVRPGDENRRVQYLVMSIWDGTLQEVRYTVRWDDGTMQQLWRPAAGQEYGMMADTRTQEGGSKLTLAQVEKLMPHLWELAARDDWKNATVDFKSPKQMQDSAAFQRAVDLQLSISTGRAVAAGYDATKTDYGVIQISFFNDTATDGMGLFVQLVS